MGIRRLVNPEMETPRVDGLKVMELIGCGGCGRVYRAEDENGTPMSLKILDEASVSRALLGKMSLRLSAGGWPSGVLPIISADFSITPAFRVSPLVADANAGGEYIPRSLQHRLADYPALESWKLVKSLARALAGMHERRVAHGNLKPGNILFEQNGDLLLTDWALGNMPGVQQCDFTDALLYQPPEQLRQPSGYLDEAGYRWDVFAFGVLAFRILTGRFPRCHATFNQVAPPPGDTRRDGIHADFAKIAKNLESQTDAPWPDLARNPLEAGFRRWIDRCLSLDPLKRPATMCEVAAAFEAVERELAVENERAQLMDRLDKAERSFGRALFGLGAVAALAIVLAGSWYLSNVKLVKAVTEGQNESRQLVAAVDQAVLDKTAAENRAYESQVELARERELGLARLESSRLIGDRLFSWSMETGHRSLPPLDGRESRLKQLERYFEGFLAGSENNERLADECAHVRLQLSEISLALGDAAGASRRLAETLGKWSGPPMDGALKFRLSGDFLMLALLRQTSADPETASAFASARKAFSEVPRQEVDAVRMDQLLAIADFHEAKLHATGGKNTLALELLGRAAQTLICIAGQRPDAVILRSQLADCYLSSATILDGAGSLGDAGEVRNLAMAELTKLLQSRPDDPAIRLDLAGCHGAMAEAAVLSGDASGAESHSREALILLDALLEDSPDHVPALLRKAAQLGLRAGIQRDRGLAAEALRDCDDGIRILKSIPASSGEWTSASFRLALLGWQKGRLLGMAGKRDEEITLICEARDVLKNLKAAGQAEAPQPEQVLRSRAYLLGDLGHAMQLATRKEDAILAFTEAVSLWEDLSASRPRTEEYSEGLAWCRQRLADMK